MRLLSALLSVLTLPGGGGRRVAVPGPGPGSGPGPGEEAAAGGIDWPAVRRLYEGREVPLGTIYERFGLTRYRLRRASLEGGWRLRPQVARPGPAQGRRPIDPHVAVRRLLPVIDATLREVTHRMGEAREEPDPARGRMAEELQALTNLLEAYDKLMREDRLRQQGGPQKGGRKSSGEPAAGGGPRTEEEARAADVEWMRAELKRRISILRRSAGLDGTDRQAGGQ